MKMISSKFDAHAWRRTVVLLTTILAAFAAVGGRETLAQRAPVHYFHRSDLPPGVVGQGQLLRGGPMAGYFQPVEIRAPEGSLISLAVEGHFYPPTTTTAKAGMLIGNVYRFKVGNIPGQPGAEVFPTIEVINRLYPPPGQSVRFPIPIELTQDELELALGGAYITRVIYLENPDDAFPAEQEDNQRYFDVGDRVDPLQVADELGRPMAILRMGSRIPSSDSATGLCMFGTPPIMIFPVIDGGELLGPGQPVPQTAPAEATVVPQVNQVDQPAARRTVLEAFRGNIPRIPLPPGVFTSGETPTMRR